MALLIMVVTRVVIGTQKTCRISWEAGQMMLSHRLASGPDPFGQNLIQLARIKSDSTWFCIILYRTSVKEHNWV